MFDQISSVGSDEGGRAPRSDVRLKPLRILLIRSGLSRPSGLSLSFARLGHYCSELVDPEESTALLAACDHDVVFVELYLESMRVLQAVARMKTSGSRPSVVIFSANDEDAVLPEIMPCGADAYVTMPLSVGSLSELLGEIRRRRAKAA